MKPILKIVSLLLRARVLFALLSLGLLASPLSVSWLNTPNQWLFRAGVELSEKPEPSNELVKITVSAKELERLVDDVPSALRLSKLLKNLGRVYTKSVVILLGDIPSNDSYVIEVLNKIFSKKSAELENKSLEIYSLLERQQLFDESIDAGSVLLAVANNKSQKNKTVTKVKYLREAQRIERSGQGNNQSLLSQVLSIILSYDKGAFNQTVLDLAEFRFESNIKGLPFYAGDNLAYPLLWRVQEDVFPDAVLSVLYKSKNSKKYNYESGSIFIDEKSLAVSAGKTIYPFYTPVLGEAAPVITLSLSEALSKEGSQFFYNKVIFIGAENSHGLDNVVAAYYGLVQQAYYTVPSWYLWAEKGGLLLLFVYLAFVLPRLRNKIAFILSGFIALFLLLASIGLQVFEKQWLPLALLLLYVLVGHACLLWRKLTVDWLGEWELVVVQKGQSPPRRPLQNVAVPGVRAGASTQSPLTKLPLTKGLFKAKDKPSALGKLIDKTFDKTMAITRPSKKLTLGRYEVDSELGRGAMGVVYLGHDPLIDRKVAIKTLNYAQFSKSELVDVKARFFREAKAVGKFNHDNIVTIYDTGEDAERAFIAMEYIAGKPLNLYAKKDSLIKSIDEVYWLMESVADALHYAHEQGVVHRDIKPSNILYDEAHEKVKVSDFGIARIIDTAATRTGEIMGSPLYMSPEQVKGEVVTGKTDIYSLGVTFYQLLTGELPFNGDTIPAITHQIVVGKYIPVTELKPKLPASAHKIITKAMYKDPKRRYADARAMMNDIVKWREKDF